MKHEGTTKGIRKRNRAGSGTEDNGSDSGHGVNYKKH